MMRFGWRPRKLVIAAVLAMLLCLMAGSAFAAPGDIVNCSEPYNISESEGYTSADSYLLEDPSGRVHLFWAERRLGDPNSVPNTPDSLMYAVWDGTSWSKPNDIFLSPREHFNRYIGSITAAIDDRGVIHLTWAGPDGLLYYSSAHSTEAASAQSWSPPVLLADDRTEVQHTAQIAYEPPDTLHVVYARSQSPATNTLEYVRSTDRGLNWSDPMLLYDVADFNRGVSNTRILTPASGTVYITWTEWDTSGNGQAVYFMRSLASGDTWDQPVLLDERIGDEYERDYANPTVLNDGRLVVFWEGGFRAYPQAQYSDDGGVTWSEPIDTFWWLIADNGFAEYLRDSAGRLHVFLIRRLREGNDDRCGLYADCGDDGSNAIWHSTWEGGNSWREPKPLFFGGGNRVNVAGERGKYVHLAWYNFVELELRVMRCEIEDAEELTPIEWPQPTPRPLPSPTPTSEPPTPTPTVRLDIDFERPELSVEQESDSSAQRMALAASLPALGVVGAVVLVFSFRRRR